MPSRYSCVNAHAITQLTRAAAAYRRMGSPSILQAAATKAGEHLRDDMQRRIAGESSLRDYQDVAQALQVYQDHRGGVHVGVPPEHPLAEKAQQMHNVYQLTDVTRDLERQSGNARRVLHEELRRQFR